MGSAGRMCGVLDVCVECWTYVWSVGHVCGVLDGYCGVIFPLTSLLSSICEWEDQPGYKTTDGKGWKQFQVDQDSGML